MKVTLTYIETAYRVWVTLTEDMDLVERIQSLLDADLNASNYADKFSLLLHCEQRTEEHDVGHLDMADVEMKAGLKASMT